MANGVIPLGKIVYVCDDVISDPTSRKLHVLGAFDAVRIPAGTTFPYSLQQLCVVAQFAGGRGQMAFRVAVAEASAGDEVFGSPTYTIVLPGGNAIVTVLIRIQECPFPCKGTFLVQLYCNGAFVDDRRLDVR